MIRSQLFATRTPVAAENGLVVGGHPFEAEAGLRMLLEGGNAIDAVVAAAFAGFVVEPHNCGLGGYGRMAIYLGGRQEFVTIDHYVRAPGRARPDSFELDLATPPAHYGHPHTVGRRAEVGHLAAAVPGAVAGLCAAHESFGRLPLAQALEPAIEAAKAGIPVTWTLALAINDRLQDIRAQPGAAELLLRNGDPPKAASPWVTGDRLENPDLAKTLRRIAQNGGAGFYSGPVAVAIEREFEQHGGILDAADLAGYRPKVLRESAARYREIDYITANDQVGYEALNILERFDLTPLNPQGADFRHLMAEAMGHAFTDNMVHYGDPEHTHSPVQGLASKRFAAERTKNIRLDRAAPRPIQPGDPWPYEDGDATAERPASGPTAGKIASTTQMAAADREGNLVTLITSLTGAFGSLVVVPGTGVILNSGMQNFDPRPEHPNCIASGKMPIFAVPCVAAAKDGRAIFGACGSGGYRIASGVLHTMVNTLDFGMTVQAAVDSPRVHCQGIETYVDSRIPAEVQAQLRGRGHVVIPQEEAPGSTYFGRVNAIWIDPKTRLMHAGSGPAWNTAAAGF